MASPQKRHRRSYGAVRRLPSGRFQARYRDPAGVERSAPQTFATRTEADTWLATTQADVARGHWRSPTRGNVTLAEYFNSWLGSRVDLRPRTLDLYRRIAERWLLREVAPRLTLGDRPLSSISPSIVREWHSATLRQSTESARRPRRVLHDVPAARAWARATGLPVATSGRLPVGLLDEWRAAGSPRPATRPPSANAGRTQAAQAYTLLRTVLASAVRDDLIDVNPCHIPGAGTVKPLERVPATPAEVELLAAAMPPRYAAAVTVAAWSGLRAGELFALTRQDVDLERGTLRVHRALVEVPGQPLAFGPPKSDAGRRVVHIPPFVTAQLREHLDTFTGPRADALVFATAAGLPLPGSRRAQLFGRARTQVGRPDLRWHDLRHTGAVLAAHTGASLAELKRRMGHSTVRAAMIYQHATDERDALLAQRLEELGKATGNVVPIAVRRAIGG